jgi:UDP-galactopyranose mutase
MRIAVAGAGFSGAVIARELADAGHGVDVFDGRGHVAGNCHAARDGDTGVMVHVYGPHIFHTAWSHVWDYVTRFGRFEPYIHKVKATTQGRVYALPVNLLTINQFFGTTMSPAEAEAFIASRSDTSIENPVNFRDQGLRFIGKELYEAFFDGYTKKQWGVDPTELPASILKRLPVRFNYDDTYFNHPYIGIPADGYTAVVEAILDHPRISVELEHPLLRPDLEGYDHCFWTGPIDDYFDHVYGHLAYRTLDFEVERHEGDYQGCPVMNYCDEDVPYTRITEFKHFAPWEQHRRTTIYREFSRSWEPGDIPYYPIRQVREKQQLVRYVELARSAEHTTFLGRLGTYRYLDMDVTVKEALDAAKGFLQHVAEGTPVPPFFTDPLGG